MLTRLYCFAPVKNGMSEASAFPMIDQQGLADLEIIFLNDGSTDGTADAVRRGGGRGRCMKTYSRRGGRLLTIGFSSATAKTQSWGYRRNRNLVGRHGANHVGQP